MPLNDSQWASAAADIFARLAGGDITEAEAATELGAATADWPTRSLSNAGLAEQLSRFKARVNGLILTDGPPADDLGGVNAVAIDLTAKVFYGPKVVSSVWPEGEPFAEGPPGKSIELGTSATHIQWRVEGEGSWTDLYPLADLAGADGREVGLRTNGGFVQWRLGTGSWTNLVALSDLTGEDGREIELGASATHLQWRYVGAAEWTDLIGLSAITPDAIPGPAAWIPVYANVADGARRVQQVVDWFGGDGTKPSTGQYVGPLGFVATAGEATDIRGAGGAGSGDMLAANNLSDLTDKFAARTTLSVYSKSEMDAALGGKATPAEIATAINTAIDALLAGAPGALNTLDELAAALGDDANFASTVTNALATKLGLGGGTMTGKLNLAASTTSGAPINLPPGVAPTSPVNGDIWQVASTGLVYRRNGFTLNLWDDSNLGGATQAEAEAGTSTTNRVWTPLRIWQAITAFVNTTRLRLLSFTERAGTYTTGALNTASGSVFDAGTINTNVTISFSNLPASPVTGDTVTMVLRATISGTPVITWPSGIVWASNTAPTLAAGDWEFVISARWTGSAWAYRGAWVKFF